MELLANYFNHMYTYMYLYKHTWVCIYLYK